MRYLKTPKGWRIDKKDNWYTRKLEVHEQCLDRNRATGGLSMLKGGKGFISEDGKRIFLRTANDCIKFDKTIAILAAKKYRTYLADLLDMLEEWDEYGISSRMSGFAGFAAVNQAEKLLGRELSETY